MKRQMIRDVADTDRITRGSNEPAIEFGEAANEDRWLSIAQVVAHSGLSARTVRRHLTDPVRPIPHYRVGGRILIRRSEFDRWVIAVSSSSHHGESTSTLKASTASDASWVRRLLDKE